ncbi:non-ribosomal peptide synthetase [Xenorhabdus indica]|uniref:non-ribosomal peptide synthetase family protein n=1 Tax=Xenorhabdus indica TaxID=333964 RepID=UPI0016571231|nr:non-ribosomal peptide synthetase [Xenorhabdus indica]MBC8943670.1 linear gramicidin synthetase subunit D [Xenorhabdus indica]
MENETLYKAVKDTLDNFLQQHLLWHCENKWHCNEYDLSILSANDASRCADLLSEFLDLSVNTQIILSSSSLDNLIDNLIDYAPELSSRTYIPSTQGQKGLWLLDQVLIQPECYNVPLLVEIGTHLDHHLLEKAITQFVEITPVLRTRFAFNQKQLYQVIEQPGNIQIVHKTLTEIIHPETVIQQMASKQYDLAKWPLFDICLITDESKQSWLVCCFHHIIVDAPSVRIIVKNILKYYCHLLRSELFGDKEYHYLKIGAGYLEFTQWQQELLAKPETSMMKEYWKQTLTPYPPMIDLPTDFPRKENKGTKADYLHLQLSHDEVLKISQQALNLAMTPFMYMAMCWQFLLYNLSGQKDITIGIPFTLRDNTDFEETVGYLVNTLPFRSYLDADITVNQFAMSVSERFVQAHLNKQLPFADMVADTGQNFGLANPVFQTLLVMIDTTNDVFRDFPFPVKLSEQYIQAAKYDLTLFIKTETSNQLVMEFNAELFEGNTIQYWLELYKQITLSIGKWGEKTLGEIEILTQEEQFYIANRSSTPFSDTGNQCVIREIEAYAKNHPNHIALMTRYSHWSYGWLDHRANQLAEFIYTNYTIGVGSRVGLLLNRNEDSIVALLAVLKTGASYVPIDPGYPSERIEYMLQDAAVDCIVTTSELVTVTSVSISRVILDEIVFAQDVNWQSVQRKPDDELYVIYTSGSTGQPKGVRLLNKTLSNLLEWQKGISVCSEGDCTLHYMSLSFDVSVQEIFATLCTGGKLYIADEEERKDLHYLQNVIELNGIHRAYFPYVALQHLAQLTVMNKAQLPTLKEVYSTGEQLVLTSDIKRMFNANRRLINLYGPSESHVCSAYIMPTNVSLWGDSASIGYPLPGFTLLALDEHKRMVPAGITGELWIISDFLSPGYHNKEHETQTRFLTGSWPGVLSQHAYKSGDLVRLKSDDTFTYLGRLDNQLKIRGFRIEPSEIEAVLNSLDGVKVSAVIGKEDTAGNKMLVAFIVATTTATLARAGLLTELRTHLPDYMIPNEFVFLSDLPTTPSGKIDRRALHDVEINGIGINQLSDFAADKLENSSISEERLTSIEQKVKSLWQKVLPNRQIKAGDNFFNIGGHSLLATQLVYLLRKQFNADFPLKLLFSTPTLRDMAASVDIYLNNNQKNNNEMQNTFINDASIQHDWTSVQQLSLSESDGVLLTGATGFLGIYLLRSLLQQLAGKVFCLVRATDSSTGLNRIIKNAHRYGIEIDFSRVEIVVGEIAETRFGLNEEEYQLLSEQVAKIYHAAAHINFVLPYSSVKGTNVDGTVEIINFCCHHQHKKLEYISTIAVFSSDYPNQPITEDCFPDHPDSLSIGYTQSKWVAEQYIQQARTQGVDINVYRIGRISGDSVTGACQEDDFLWRQIKSFIQMGIALYPELLNTDLLPVDFVSQVIVTLSVSNKIPGHHNFHLFHPKGTDFTPVYLALKHKGYNIKTVSQSVWLEKLEKMVVNGDDVALGSLVHLFKEQTLTIGNNTYNNQMTHQMIRNCGFDFPDITVRTFTKLIAYFMDKKYEPEYK